MAEIHEFHWDSFTSIGPTNSMEFPPSIFARSYSYSQNRLFQKMHEIARWWFQTFFIFIPTWRNDPISQAYVSNGFPHLGLGGFE